MDYPTVPGGKGNQAIERMTGGTYVIRQSSQHTEEAVAFLNFLTHEENGLKWIQYTQSPFSVNVGFKEHVSQQFLQELFASRADTSDLLVSGIGTFFNVEEYKVWTRDVGIAFMGGDMPIEEVIRKLDKRNKTCPTPTHNQRNLGTLMIEVPHNDKSVDADELISIVEHAFSSPTYSLLKRKEEGELVLQAHLTPKFVEDVVRDMLSQILKNYPHLPDDVLVIARSESEESIHKHNAFAERVTTLGELRK